MAFTLRIETDNAAFGNNGDDCRAEVARILRTLATAVYTDASGSVRDINGNMVGQWSLDDDGE